MKKEPNHSDRDEIAFGYAFIGSATAMVFAIILKMNADGHLVGKPYLVVCVIYLLIGAAVEIVLYKKEDVITEKFYRFYTVAKSSVLIAMLAAAFSVLQYFYGEW